MARPLAQVEGLPPGREAQILHLAGRGMTDVEIAEKLGIRPSTVNAYWKRSLQSEGARTRTQLVAASHEATIKRLQATLRVRDMKIQRLEASIAALEESLRQKVSED